MKKLYSFLADFLITLFSAVTLFASVLLVPASIPVFIDTGLPSLAEAGVVPAPGGRLQSKPSKTSMTTTFTMEDLGTLGITSEGSYVNDSGDVTGVNNYGGNPSVFRTFLYRNGQMTDIGTLPGATQSFPAGINSNGDLAGTSTGSISHAFLYRDGVMTDLGTFGGSTSAASGISDNGDVVGAARTTNDFAQIAFVYRNGVLNNLGTLGGRNSIAIAINSNGDVVGDAQIADGSQHAFLYRNGVMTDLGTLGGSSSQALAMNAAGDVVGRSYLAGDIIEHAFVYRNGQMTDLGTLGGTYSNAIDINDYGDIVGTSDITGDVYARAFLHRNGQMTEIPNLDRRRTTPTRINNNGDVVGWGDLGLPEFAFLYRNGQVEDLGTLGGTTARANAISDGGYITGRSYLLQPVNDPPFHAFRVNAGTSPTPHYRLSGSSDGTASIVVDDALDVYINGVLFYTDGNAAAGARSPIYIPTGTLGTGDVLRFVVRDTYGVCASLSPIYLVDNVGGSVQADPGFSLGCGQPAGDNGVVHDESFTVPSAADNTPPGTNVSVTPLAGDASVTFSAVGASGNTTFTPIDPSTAGLPPGGFTLCPTCPAYDITTTATYNPPVTVCLDVPAGIDAATFNTMALLHGENGVLVDVTTARIPNVDPRQICGVVTSLSPFALAFGNSPPTLTNVAATGPINEGSSTTLAGNIGDANSGDAFTLTVDWGDGSAPQPFNYPSGTTSFSETHVYADNPAGQPYGSYTISVLLDDGNGGSDTDSASVTVNNADPTLSNVGATPSTIVVGSSTTVSATVADVGLLDTFRVRISWGDNSPPTEFLPAAGSFSRDHQYTDAGQYSVDITVTDDDGGESTSNVVITVNPAPSLPAAPSSLTATANSTGQITLGWADNSNNENGFRIERCTRKNCTNFVQIAEVAADATSFPNIGLNKGTEYRYRIRAFNADGSSAYSNIASAKTLRK